MCSLWNVFEVKFSFSIFFFGLLVRLSLYIRKSAGAVGVLIYRLLLCAGGVVVPHTFTCPPVSQSFGRVAVEALPTIVTKSPGRVVFATEANSSTLLAREQVQLSVEVTSPCMQITITRCKIKTLHKGQDGLAQGYLTFARVQVRHRLVEVPEIALTTVMAVSTSRIISAFYAHPAAGFSREGVQALVKTTTTGVEITITG